MFETSPLSPLKFMKQVILKRPQVIVLGIFAFLFFFILYNRLLFWGIPVYWTLNVTFGLLLMTGIIYFMIDTTDKD